MRRTDGRGSVLLAEGDHAAQVSELGMRFDVDGPLGRELHTSMHYNPSQYLRVLLEYSVHMIELCKDT